MLDEARKLFEGKVRNFYQIGMQDFNLKIKYDCMWVQGVLMYLLDEDCLNFLKKARDCLAERKCEKSGLLFIKENVVTLDDHFIVDKNDNSIMRTEPHFQELFERAGLEIITSFLHK
jgi:protein N-terminal methyltransferase